MGCGGRIIWEVDCVFFLLGYGIDFWESWFLVILGLRRERIRWFCIEDLGF